MMDWLSWSNGFYLLGLIIAGLAVIMASKYKTLMKEIGDVSKVLEEAYADGKLSNAEKKRIMKEVLDVLKSVINLKWKIF
jgi:polyhydroxyalkanoate synthesis regulator phasin|tara:strand:+ start:221 stop:460 length:240 start_codon:yes stop_codon:yes gene_type:complete